MRQLVGSCWVAFVAAATAAGYWWRTSKRSAFCSGGVAAYGSARPALAASPERGVDVAGVEGGLAVGERAGAQQRQRAGAEREDGQRDERDPLGLARPLRARAAAVGEHHRGEQQERAGDDRQLPGPVDADRHAERHGPGGRGREPGAAVARAPRARCTPAYEDGAEEAEQQQQADPARFGERLEVERVSVLDGPDQGAVLRPPELVGARPDAGQRLRLVGVDGGLPVLVAALAAGGAEARVRASRCWSGS